MAFEIRVNVSFYDRLKILKVSIKLNSTSLIWPWRIWATIIEVLYLHMSEKLSIQAFFILWMGKSDFREKGLFQAMQPGMRIWSHEPLAKASSLPSCPVPLLPLHSPLFHSSFPFFLLPSSLQLTLLYISSVFPALVDLYQRLLVCHYVESGARGGRERREGRKEGKRAISGSANEQDSNVEVGLEPIRCLWEE